MKAPAPISVKSEIKNWCGPPVFNQLGQWDIDGALSAWEGCAIASWWAMGDERLMELSLSFQKVEHISSVSNYNRLTLEDT